jgi:hypothetical protein
MGIVHQVAFAQQLSPCKIITITYTECVSVVLVSQQSKRMHRSTLLSVACQALPYFSHYFEESKVFGKRLLNIKRVF